MTDIFVSEKPLLSLKQPIATLVINNVAGHVDLEFMREICGGIGDNPDRALCAAGDAHSKPGMVQLTIKYAGTCKIFISRDEANTLIESAKKFVDSAVD